MKLRYYLIFFISIFIVSSCSYSQIALGPNSRENYLVYYDDSIPDSLKEILDISFNHTTLDDDDEKTRIYLKNFDSNNYNIYAGSSLRSLEGEVTVSVQLEIISKLKTKNKSIKVMKRHKSSELNPFAEQETVESLKKIINNEIYNQLLLEVSLFEM
jgi:hypothetical protein